MADIAMPADPTLDYLKSRELFGRGKSVFPDGTTRATVERSNGPRYALRGEGAYIIDVDGRRVLDLNNNFTTLIHGHGFPPVIEAVTSALRDGICFANPTESEIALAEILTLRIPAVERIRFVNTGTEAVMFAIKAARAFTGKSGVARAEGAYHGAYDWAEAGQGNTPPNWGHNERPNAVPAYRGTPETVGSDVIVFQFNDIAGTEQRIRENADKLACILIDPMPSRAGLLHPDPAFLDLLTRLARQYDILILADEVLNVRQGFQGACSRHGLTPDLIALGKIIGGGFPIGAVGGREEIMSMFSASFGTPLVPQGGTFSANPISMIAGRKAMEAMTPAAYGELNAMGEYLRQEITASIKRRDARFCVTGDASLFRIHPKTRHPCDFRQAYPSAEEVTRMVRLSTCFLEHGILLPSGAAACLSTAMTQTDIENIIATFNAFLSVTP